MIRKIELIGKVNYRLRRWEFKAIPDRAGAWEGCFPIGRRADDVILRSFSERRMGFWMGEAMDDGSLLATSLRSRSAFGEPTLYQVV